MDDVEMIAKIDGDTTLYVSPVHENTYFEYVENDNLGGASGYFIARERYGQFELLAKSPSLDAARELFTLITNGREWR